MAKIRMMRPTLPTVDLRTAKPAPTERTNPGGGDARYWTQQHRKWAAAVCKRADYRCQAVNCKTPHRGFGNRVYADHIRELKDGGAPFDMANGQCLCSSCHGKKTHQAMVERVTAPMRMPVLK